MEIELGKEYLFIPVEGQLASLHGRTFVPRFRIPGTRLIEGDLGDFEGWCVFPEELVDPEVKSG